MKLLRLPWFLAMTALSIPVPAQTIAARLDAAKTSAPISPFVYGQFLEHIGGLINNGLWAEMLDDRKFFNAIPTPPTHGGTPGFGRSRLRVWTIVGPVEAVSMDSAEPFVGKHSPRISLSGSEPRGIEQSGIAIEAGRAYVGRVALSGSPDAKVTVALVWGNQPNERRTVELRSLSDQYRTFRFRIKPTAASDQARLQIVGSGTGSFAVGAASLMPADNLGGFRREVIEVLRSLRSGVYRFPGGNYVSAHEWRDAIGDPDRRAPKFDPVWGSVQPNDVGTDEFLRFCRLIDVEPYITVSSGFGDAQSAKAYVEYCNGAPTTPMGRLRAQNGHRAPYGVRYWGIGNEMWGVSYQFGAMKLNQYLAKHNDFAEAMRQVDPSIKLIGSGAMADTMTGSGEALHLGDSLIPKPLGPADWTGNLFLHCLDTMDLVSEHFYNYGETHYDLSKAKQVPNDANEPLVDWMRRPANHVKIKVEEYKAYEQIIPALTKKPVPICLDEWAYAGGPPNSFHVAPAYAWAFHEMFRHSDLYQMACFTFATSLFTANHTQATLNPAGMVFKLYRDHFGYIPIAVSGESPQPRPTDPPGGEQPEVNAGSDTYPLDVAAAWTTNREALTIAVVNPTETEQRLALSIDHAVLSGQGTLWRMAPDNLDAVVSVGHKPEVQVEAIPLDTLPGTVVVPKHSVSIYVLKTR